MSPDSVDTNKSVPGSFFEKNERICSPIVTTPKIDTKNTFLSGEIIFDVEIITTTMPIEMNEMTMEKRRMNVTLFSYDRSFMPCLLMISV